MSVDLLLWILALLCFLAGAYGTLRGRAELIAVGWVGFALAALTFIAH